MYVSFLDCFSVGEMKSGSFFLLSASDLQLSDSLLFLVDCLFSSELLAPKLAFSIDLTVCSFVDALALL